MASSSTDDAPISSIGRCCPEVRPQATTTAAREVLGALAAAYEDAQLVDLTEAAQIPESARHAAVLSSPTGHHHRSG